MSGMGHEIAAIIKHQIKQYENVTKETQNGTVVTVGDGIAGVFGLDHVMAGEQVLFEGGERGVAMNLEEHTVSVALLGDYSGIREGSRAHRSEELLSVPVGEGVIGRVVNALGEAVDGKGPTGCTLQYPVERPAPGIMQRQRVCVPLSTGIKAIDSMIPIGRGQRELIVGDRQTGKTTIALDTILNQKDTGVICIYVAIGQKNATVAAIAETLWSAGADRYTVIVAATAAEGAPMQYIAPYAGCAMGEYFMERGRDVLIVYDDLSRHAVAYRALSLLIRRPPGREAYPGDVFYLHARLLERSANLAPEYGGGSMTALPIVETQAGDVSSYIPTNVISITDGQIYLEADLFRAGIIPAVNPGISVSRVGGAAQTAAMKKVAAPLRLLYSQYRELKAFSQFGSDLDTDTAARLARGERIVAVLGQKRNAPVSTEVQVAVLYAVVNGFFDELPVEEVTICEKELERYLRAHCRPLMERVAAGQLSAEDEEEMKQAVNQCVKQFVHRKPADGREISHER